MAVASAGPYASLPPNQQRQSTEGLIIAKEMLLPMDSEEVILHHKSVTHETNFVILSLLLSERISA